MTPIVSFQLNKAKEGRLELFKSGLTQFPSWETEVLVFPISKGLPLLIPSLIVAMQERNRYG